MDLNIPWYAITKEDYFGFQPTPCAPRTLGHHKVVGRRHRLCTDLVFVLGLHGGKVEITAEAVRDTRLYHTTVTATATVVVVLVALRADPAGLQFNRSISV